MILPELVKDVTKHVALVPDLTPIDVSLVVINFTYSKKHVFQIVQKDIINLVPLISVSPVQLIVPIVTEMKINYSAENVYLHTSNLTNNVSLNVQLNIGMTELTESVNSVITHVLPVTKTEFRELVILVMINGYIKDIVLIVQKDTMQPINQKESVKLVILLVKLVLVKNVVLNVHSLSS